MLVDVLQKVSQESITNGVILYRFTLDTGLTPGEYIPDRNRSTWHRFDLFFCRSGALTLRRKHSADVKIGQEEIVLLSDFPDLVSIIVQEPPVGYCLVIDPTTYSTFDSIYRTLGHTTWSYEHVQTFLQKYGGYLQIKHGSWSQSMFSTLHSLPATQQGFYCILKGVELCYLLHTHQSLSDNIVQQSSMSTYIMERLICIETYIKNHLDEKLTISLLCREFNLSPTTLKNKFREFYGQPIHKWIQQLRIRRAAELLQSTNLTILQIAQNVGYESVSQFNVVFRQTYGITPSLYKKNVRYRKKLADSVGNGNAPII